MASAPARSISPSSEPSWPPLEWEEREWVSSLPPGMGSRTLRRRHAGPYDAAVPPAIAGLEVTLPSAALALADEASTEIARFDAEMGAEIAPFGAILLRSESSSSSKIENLTSGARAIALAELGNEDRRNASEIVANVHAMQAAIELADRLDEDAVLAMHAALMERHHPEHAGQWRTEQVWIGGGDFGPHGAAFVPPHKDRVPAAMTDLMRFVKRDDLPVLAHAALAHAQFETIHPFADGNGRTGRALIHSMLRAKALTRNVTVPVSAGLLTDTGAYFAALTAYRRGDAARIVSLLAEASFAAIANGRALVADLHSTRERWNATIAARQDAAAWRLAELILRQPVIDAELVQNELGATSANAQRAIRQLAEAGILTEFSGKRRNRMWQTREVLSALDEFAARAGRRRLSHR
jgi:Fic family protein